MSHIPMMHSTLCWLLAVCCMPWRLHSLALSSPERLYPAATMFSWRCLLFRMNGGTLAVLVSLPLAVIVPRGTFGFGLPASCVVLAPRAAAATSLRATVPADIGTNLPTDNAFRLRQYRDAVELQTASYKVTPRRRSVPVPDSPATTGSTVSTATSSSTTRARDGAESAGVEIVLVSMVHLADQAYYREIMREASNYDRVLFELIAGSDVSELDQAGNRAVTEYMYPTREQELLARNYGLAAQLNCLNYCHLCKERAGAGSSRRWILADLSRDKVQALQKSEGEKEMGQPGWQDFVEEVTRALLVGRQAGDQFLPKFFPPLGSSLNRPALALRALLWLAPCPEAEIMLLDWARTYPRAGGLSVLASAIVERALAGDFFTARKLGFAQQIVSGQAGGGNWGQSDEVVVKARNKVVVAETERALSEGCHKIMILYGGLHMQDLAYQLCRQLDATREPAGWRTAWVVPMRTRSRGKTMPPPVAAEERKGRVGTLGDEGIDDGTRWGPLAVAALAYVAVGAWDWTDTVEALARDLTSGAPPAESIASALLVCVLYVARHAYLYYGLARWLVQWESKLF